MRFVTQVVHVSADTPWVATALSVCPVCQGTGEDPTVNVCEDCHGDGYAYTLAPARMHRRTAIATVVSDAGWMGPLLTDAPIFQRATPAPGRS